MGSYKARSDKNAFKKGVFQEIHLEKGLLLFKRAGSKESIYVYVNNAEEAYKLNLKGNYTELLSQKTFAQTLTIAPYSYGILIKNA